MKQIINLTSIANYLKTRYDITEVLSVIDKVQSEIFKKQRSFSDILEKDAPFPLSDSLKKLAVAHEANLEDPIEADKFFGKVREAINRLPILTITTGISPTLELINDVNEWVSVNIKGFIAIDFVVNRALIAGAVINFNGKSRDYSVKKQSFKVETIQNTELN